jgi:hypothetical protein
MPYVPVLTQVQTQPDRPPMNSVLEVGVTVPARLNEGLDELLDLELAIGEIKKLESSRDTLDFFPSSEWLSCYLKAWPVDTKAYSFKYRLGDTNQFAYAFASLGDRKSRVGFRVRSLTLNEAPEGILPDVHIEKNGFIGLDRTLIAEPLRHFIDQALERKIEWDEIRLNSIDESAGPAIKALAKQYGLICYQTYSARSYLVDFNKVLELYNGNYLSSRSTNTRAQIRQSTRRIEKELGVIRVVEALSIEQAHDWFDALAAWHRQRWNRNGEVNNLNDGAFLGFLKSNINQLLPKKKLSLLRVNAGDTTLAFYYYYACAEKIYFYLGGVNYALLASLRPGLVSHFCAAQYFFENGKTVYDFMEGDSRYKASLATSTSVNQGWILQRRTKRLSAEHFLRRIKRWGFKKNLMAESGSEEHGHLESHMDGHVDGHV